MRRPCLPAGPFREAAVFSETENIWTRPTCGILYGIEESTFELLNAIGLRIDDRTAKLFR